jgi:hypothetical protein
MKISFWIMHSVVTPIAEPHDNLDGPRRGHYGDIYVWIWECESFDSERGRGRLEDRRESKVSELRKCECDLIAMNKER